MSNNGQSPMRLHHDSMDATVERLAEMQKAARERLVTAPAVGEPQSRGQETINYLRVRNNPEQLAILWQQYGLRRLVQYVVEEEAKLQRRMQEAE